MALPYDLYIRFLATKNVVDIHEVNEHLEDLNLPEISQSDLDKQYDVIAKTVPKGLITQIENKSYSVDFMKWMRVLEVSELWYYEKEFKDPDKRPLIKLVYDIHQDPELRMSINALLIKAVPVNEIVASVGAKFATLLKDDHIALYREMFFNPARMTRRDWRNFLHRCTSKEVKVYFAALSEDVNAVKNELELPCQINVSRTLQFLVGKTFQKAKQYLESSTREANQEARHWIQQTTLLIDKYEKYRVADTADFGNALQLEFDFVESEHPVPDSDTLKELQSELKKKELQRDDIEKSGDEKDEGDNSTSGKEGDQGNLFDGGGDS